MLILNYYINKDNLKLNRDTQEIYNLSEKIKYKSREEYENGIWTFIENNNLDTIGISDIKSGYKISYPISNAFDFLKNDSNNCNIYTCNKIC